jgi:ABC-type glutathione transport system ATPase component
MQVADRVIVLNDGRIQHDGKPAEVLPALVRPAPPRSDPPQGMDVLPAA